MGTGSVESLVLKWSGRLPTVPVPILGGRFCEDLTCFGLGASPPFSLPFTV